MIWLARFLIGGIAIVLWLKDAYYWIWGRIYRRKIWRQIEQAMEQEKSRRAHPSSHHLEPPLQDLTIWDDDDWPIHGDDWRSFYMQDPDNGPQDK